MMNLIELHKKSIAVLMLAFLATAMLTACSSDFRRDKRRGTVYG